jgi:signal transduction histidine kinase
MNVRTKLLVSQSLNVTLVVAVAVVAVIVAQRFDDELRRADVAYDERQTITMLAVQAFHYKTAIARLVSEGSGDGAELGLAREEVRRSLRQLARQTDEEVSLVGSDERPAELDEKIRIGRLDAGFAAVDSLVDRMVALLRAGSTTEALQLNDIVEQRFQGEIAETLAAAMADEEREVAAVDARIADLAARRVALLGVAGACALALSIATAVYLTRTLSRPIRRLTEGVRALEEGDLKHRVAWSGRDEFALLAAQFNEMAAALEDRQRRILATQADLEHQVAARTRELEALNRRLNYLDRQRLTFLADVSHELRTPVTILRGEAEVTLRSRPASADAYRETLERVVLQAEQMGRLIDDLLFLVRSEADTVAFQKHRTDLQEVVADAVREGKVLAQGKGLAVSLELPGLPVWTEADPQRLRQAVLIAIDNAVKYSRANAAIEVALARQDGRAAITVTDHGVGVPAEELPYVFERFYRIRGASGGRPDGSGLGLPIARWIVEKHDGTIAMTSTPGEETRLTIELATLERSGP